MIFFCVDIEMDHPPREPPSFQEDEIIWIAFFSVAGETRTNSISTFFIFHDLSNETNIVYVILTY
ncbi:unnamed protein product [Cuscuta europaea]|uniref:Uncharacterized protein n=1 Tax=Cuscuta europaea TaxID=41803 RepID=A0A9P0YPP0_CUSEU|nr:unnamed protein product [Cuscuta europaea]